MLFMAVYKEAPKFILFWYLLKKIPNQTLKVVITDVWLLAAIVKQFSNWEIAE